MQRIAYLGFLTEKIRNEHVVSFKNRWMRYYKIQAFESKHTSQSLSKLQNLYKTSALAKSLRTLSVFGVDQPEALLNVINFNYSNWILREFKPRKEKTFP